jgi:small-conductance mechanosensitive channel
MMSPSTLVGAVTWAIILLGVATLLSVLIHRFTHRVESRLSDVTGLRFASSLTQLFVYVTAATIYVHLVPELRVLGTALLAGVSVLSIIVGFSAQGTLGNLIAGLAIVLYRLIRIGDVIRLTTPKGPSTATVIAVSLGYTLLKDTDGEEIVVPNTVMLNSIIVRLKTGTDVQTH